MPVEHAARANIRDGRRSRAAAAGDGDQGRIDVTGAARDRMEIDAMPLVPVGRQKRFGQW